MVNVQDFYSNYDVIIRQICRNYDSSLELGARNLPVDVGSVCDLGIGTGNFSLAVRRIYPTVPITGVDNNTNFIEIARSKLPDVKIDNRNLFNCYLPKADYFISSLTLHHLNPKDREEKIKRWLSNCRGFINFDIALSDGKTKQDVIDSIVDFSRGSFPDVQSLEAIASEIRSNDNPSDVEEERKIFESVGFNFQIISQDFPFFLYHASR